MKLFNIIEIYKIKYLLQILLKIHFHYFTMASKETTPKCVQHSYSISDKLETVKRLKELSGSLSAALRELEIDRKHLRE